MNDMKTMANTKNVSHFIQTVENDRRRKDALFLLDLMKDITKDEPRMWGESIVGFGSYHYKYDSGREGDWFITGFSPGKQKLSIYVIPGFDHYPGLMKKLGKYKTGKSCLYVNKLEDVDRTVLRELLDQSVKFMRDKYQA
jgi:hypothetical protein